MGLQKRPRCVWECVHEKKEQNAKKAGGRWGGKWRGAGEWGKRQKDRELQGWPWKAASAASSFLVRACPCLPYLPYFLTTHTHPLMNLLLDQERGGSPEAADGAEGCSSATSSSGLRGRRRTHTMKTCSSGNLASDTLWRRGRSASLAALAGKGASRLVARTSSKGGNRRALV